MIPSIKYALIPLLILFVVFFLNFNKNKEFSKPKHGMYYWDTYFQIPEDQNLKSQYNISTLYIKFFDIVYDSEKLAVPNGETHFSSEIPNYLDEIVPVVFITNETINQLDSNGIETLADKMTLRLNNEVKRTRIVSKVKQWQVDCDWTKRTKDKYFYLLQLLGKSTSNVVTCTIRLHQYKYYQNNIPPVKRGVLMCYNISDPKNFDVENSIFSYGETMKYIEDVKYPLPLDIALPSFSWGVMFDSQKEFEGFCSKINLEDIQKDSCFAKTERENVYTSKYTHEKFGRFFRKGNMVRVENVNPDDVVKIKSYLLSALKKYNPSIVLFRYDPFQSNVLTPDETQKIFESN